MKKFIICALASAFVFAACSDSDNNNKSGTSKDAITVDFDKYCKNVMGQSCGHPISDDTINDCKSFYSMDLENKDICKKKVADYYNCIADIAPKSCGDSANCDCIEDDACAAEFDSAKTCVDGSLAGVDYVKFCDIIMGVTCGHSIDNVVLGQCQEVYINEAANHPKCKDAIASYYKCVLNLDANDNASPKAYCDSEDDFCQDEVEASVKCLDDNYPAVKATRAALASSSNDVDFDAFCNTILGKICEDDNTPDAEKISDEDLAWCAEIYKEEFIAHADCKDAFATYYNAVIALSKDVFCDDDSNDDLVEEQINGVYKCVLEKYPVEGADNGLIDFPKFCSVIMGKTCGNYVGDRSLEECENMYKEETIYYSKCITKAMDYYNCVAVLTPAACSTPGKDCVCEIADDACEVELDAYSSCVSQNYSSK